MLGKGKKKLIKNKIYNLLTLKLKTFSFINGKFIIILVHKITLKMSQRKKISLKFIIEA